MSNQPKRLLSTSVAWGDESVRMALDPPCYLIAACFLEDSSGDPPPSISALEAIKPKNARKLHWMDMNKAQKAKSANVIAKLNAEHVVVAAVPLIGNKQERARRKCLELLLPLLEQKGVSTLILESRGTKNDEKDIKHLLALRRMGLVKKIRIEHAKGSDNPALWIPDQVLGIIGEGLSKNRVSWREFIPEELNKRIEIVEIEI